MAKAAHAPAPTPAPAAPAHGHAPAAATVAPAHPTAGIPKGLIVLFVVLFIAFGIWGINALSPKSEKTKSTENAIGTDFSSHFDTTITLIKGQKPRFKVPVWYNYEISDPGKEFGHRVEDNAKVDTMGGGRPYTRPSEHVRSFELIALKDDSLSITVYFSKK